MTASEKLYDIFSPALDSENRISLADAEQRVSEAGLNIEEEFGFDSLQDTIEELDNHFVLEEVDGTTYIKCLNVQPQVSPEEELPPTVEDEKPAEKEEVEEQPATTPASTQALTSKQKKYIINKIKLTIYNISKNIRPNAEGLAAIPLLGIKLREHGVSDFGGKKLTEFMNEFPDKFEIITRDGTLYAHVVEKKAEKEAEGGAVAQSSSPQPQMATSATKSFTETKKHISMYKLLDFALFPNYASVLEQLAEMAEADGWFVLTDPDDPQPYYMVDLKLRHNFALAVEQYKKGEDSGITIGLDQASFITGFQTAEGKQITAHFVTNRLRDGINCQSWLFDSFTVEE